MRRRARSRRSRDKLLVKLDKAYGTEETIDVAVGYSGSPSRGLYFVDPAGPNPKKTLSFWTQGESEDTRFWLPCYDYPNERATSEMIITVPKPLVRPVERGAGRDQGWRGRDNDLPLEDERAPCRAT